jgi:hypothetical protein
VDQIPLVERKIDDGHRLVHRLLDDGFDVTAAFWLNAGEDRWWHFYIASKIVDERGPVEAYRALQATLAQLPGISIALEGIKLIGASSPITRDALKIRKRHAGVELIRLSGTRLGGLNVEEAIIYPADYSEPDKIFVDAVNKVDVVNGRLQVTKTTLSIPRHGVPPPLPAEWVSDVNVVNDQLVVEKVKIVQSPEGLKAEYREEAHPGASAIKGFSTKRKPPDGPG